MRLQDKIDSVIAVGQANGKIMLDGYTCAVLIDCKALADVAEAIHIAMKMGCSGNEILERHGTIRLSIESIIGEGE